MNPQEQNSSELSSVSLPLGAESKTRYFKIILAAGIVAVILIASILYLILYKKVPKESLLFPVSKSGYYSVQRNADLSYDYYFMGEIKSVSENSNNYILTISSIFPSNKGLLINLSVPKNLPPKEGEVVIGKNFQEMVGRNFKAVNIRIRYDKNNNVVEWELLQKVNLKKS